MRACFSVRSSGKFLEFKLPQRQLATLFETLDGRIVEDQGNASHPILLSRQPSRIKTCARLAAADCNVSQHNLDCCSISLGVANCKTHKFSTANAGHWLSQHNIFEGSSLCEIRMHQVLQQAYIMV